MKRESMKSAYYIILVTVLLASCSTAPLENSINTAIAQTQAAQPTSTPIPTNTPFPTTTPTHVPTPTVTLAPATSCSPDFHLVDIVSASGKGVFVTVNCAESDPNNFLDIQVILPSGTTRSMVEDTLQYIHKVAKVYGLDVNDIDEVYLLATSDCTGNFVTSREVSGFCIAVGKESTIIAFLETPKK
jgi:hypothetical protein